jgi:hypothetical protein
VEVQGFVLVPWKIKCMLRIIFDRTFFHYYLLAACVHIYIFFFMELRAVCNTEFSEI